MDNPITATIDNLIQDRKLLGGSSKWANWESILYIFTCHICFENHGKIFDISILKNKKDVNAHPKCHCKYVEMRTKVVGTATEKGEDGADVYLMQNGKLPNYYVTKEYAKQHGWRKKLSQVLPGKVLGGDIFLNDDQKLPNQFGRIWYEADINYTSGKRNRDRLLYSNDGLAFVSYDHYQTFYELIEREEIFDE